MKLTLYMTMSLDGYIAKDDDSTPWSENAWRASAELVKSKGNMIIGRRTFDIMKAENEFEKIRSPFTVVLSETRESPSDGKTLFVKTPEEALAVLKGQGFTEALLGGGPTANTAFLIAGLIDELVLDIEPILLGSGKHVFAADSILPKLRFLSSDSDEKNLTRLRYAVVRG